MDNLTHTLFGLTLARTPLGRAGRGVTTALVLASNAPDIDAVVGPRLKIVESIVQAAVDDGDIDAATVTPLTARVGPALINHHFLLKGEPPNRRELALVVDTVIPPALSAGSQQAARSAAAPAMRGVGRLSELVCFECPK